LLYGEDVTCERGSRRRQEVAKGTLLVGFRPGQYFFVTLPSVGDEDAKGLRRHITVVTSPNEKGVLNFGKRIGASMVSRRPSPRPLDERPGQVGTSASELLFRSLC
jgi:hypothetical protein